MSLCSSSSSKALGYVRIDKDKAILACRMHIRDKRRNWTRSKIVAIREEIEKKRKGFLGLGFGAKEITRGESIQRLKSKEQFAGTAWDRACGKMFGMRWSSSASSVLNAAMRIDGQSMFIAIDTWSWLSSWLPEEQRELI